MSLLTSASRQAKRVEQAHFFMPERLHGERSGRAHWLVWGLGLPLFAALGIATNYGWHLLNNKPVMQRVEVPQATELPFTPVKPDYEFVTEPLPYAVPESAIADTPAESAPVVDKTAENDDSSPEPVDTRNSLEKRFMQAVNETAQSEHLPVTSEPASESQDATPLAALPARISQQVPAMKYGSHVYSSVSANRTININGRDYHEGDEVAAGVVLLRIEPEASIFRVGSQSFSLNALTDWQGY